MEAGADGRTPRNPLLDPSFSHEPVVTYRGALIDE
jgi:hypothetical protein